MTRILVVADNHGKTYNLKQIFKREAYDLALHLGDGEVDLKWLAKNFDHFVCGNHEFWEPLEKRITVEGVNILMLHGHTRGISVWNSAKKAKQVLKDQTIDLLIHGHTHIFAFEQRGHKAWLCPGSTDLARGPEGNGYAILIVNQGKIVSVEFKKV